MIRGALLAISLFVVANCAAAQSVTVRSGEHDGHTRLVAQVPHGTEWALTQKKNGARLKVAIDDVRFETGSVFARLSSARLSTLSQARSGAELDMEFGCDCAASAFLYQGTMIVIDIAPVDVLPPLGPLLVSVPDISQGFEQEQSASDRAPKPFALPLLEQGLQRIEERLSTRFVQGADRDVLDLNLAGQGPRRVPEVHDLEDLPDLEPNFRVSSVLEDLPGFPVPDIQPVPSRPACLTRAEIGFDSWSDGRSFSEQIADLRVGLFEEFDRVDSETVMKLARLYAFHGFGIEALQVLDLTTSQSSDRDRIAAIARIIDDQTVAEPNPFESLQRCTSDAALWSVLSEQTLRSDADLEAIEQAFPRLPDHLQRHFGPSLANILVEGQKLEAARRILRTIDRVEPESRPEVGRAKAAVASAEGDDPQTEALLNEVISSPDAVLEAPLALAQLIEKRWGERGAVSAQEVDLAAAYVLEFRRSEIGSMMLQAHAVALSLSDQFDAAVDLAESLPASEGRAGTLNQVMLMVAERSDDVTFLRRTLGLADDFVSDLSTETAIALSDRLAMLGFASKAHFFASRPQDSIKRSERARLRARAALLGGRPHQAMLELADDDSVQADLLRIEVARIVGDFEKAGELSKKLGTLNEADRYFWLANLTDQTADQNGQFAKIAATTRALANQPARNPAKPLTDAAYLLKDSEDTRQKIAELLAALDP